MPFLIDQVEAIGERRGKLGVEQRALRQGHLEDVVDPIVEEDTGKPVLDDEGNLTFPRVRVFTRNNPDFPELDGLQEWKSWVRADSQFVLLAGDAIFMKSLINTFFFAIICRMKTMRAFSLFLSILFFFAFSM